MAINTIAQTLGIALENGGGRGLGGVAGSRLFRSVVLCRFCLAFVLLGCGVPCCAVLWLQLPAKRGAYMMELEKQEALGPISLKLLTLGLKVFQKFDCFRRTGDATLARTAIMNNGEI